MRKIFSAVGFIICFNIIAFSQDSVSGHSGGNDPYNHWHLLDPTQDGVVGTGAERAYKELLAGKQSSPVVVAIIDSGSESFHPDLQANIWTNEDEVPGNGQDDDHNGYVDDIHGWSFIGGPDGDVSYDNLEFTRIYRDLKKRFGSVVDGNNVSSEDKKDYERYLRMKPEFERRSKEAEEDLAQYMMVATFYENADAAIKQVLGKDNYTLAEVEAIDAQDEFMKAAQGFIILAITENFAGEIDEGVKHFESLARYQLNLEFDPRYMVGDNYEDVNQKNYGNNHIDGPESDHGTHVGGIVGAVWNDYGMKGVAENVRLMIIRCVPNGDERDKDVANSIRYAADNGARIINMSFGKSFSPQKDAVDAAVKYAESKGVLLIHAAGNDGKNIDVEPNFPKDKYDDGTYCSTWLEIGASDRHRDALAADFSNYGKESVDVFAPGVDIYSTVTDGKYKDNSGTSMAAPVTSGVAATLMSYYPNLSAKDVKAILMQSATDCGDAKIIRYEPKKGMGRFFAKIFVSKKRAESEMPSPREFRKKKVRFDKYSQTGGVVNLYQAVKMAETWKK